MMSEMTLAAAAMMGAAVLVPTLALLLPNDTRCSCVDTDEGRTDTGWVTRDGGCCSATARPRELRRFANQLPLQCFTVACSRLHVRSQLPCVRGPPQRCAALSRLWYAHSGTTYGFFTTAGAGVGFGVGADESALNVALAGVHCHHCIQCQSPFFINILITEMILGGMEIGVHLTRRQRWNAKHDTVGGRIVSELMASHARASFVRLIL